MNTMNMNGYSWMTFLQKYQTNNYMVDMMIATMLPTFIAFLTTNYRNWIMMVMKVVYNYFFPSTPPVVEEKRLWYYRTIVHEYMLVQSNVSNGRISRITKPGNVYLLDAIQWYLTDGPKSKIWKTQQEYYSFGRSSDGRISGGVTSQMFKDCAIFRAPPSNQWVEIDADHEIAIMYTSGKVSLGTAQDAQVVDKDLNKKDEASAATGVSAAADDMKGSTNVGVYNDSLNIRGPTAESIQEFLEEVIECFSAKLEEDEKSDDQLYLYLMSENAPANQRNAVASDLVFQSYPLQNTKTFDAMFFPQKNHMMKTLNNFLYKQGTYQRPGAPYKLGILLHGPPGTGKTSFVKSLANYMHRHIVSVSLDKIKTVGQLHKLMYEREIGRGGSNNSSSSSRSSTSVYPYSKLIFVLEELDVCLDIVKCREQKAQEARQKQLAMFDGSDEHDFETGLMNKKRPHGKQQEDNVSTTNTGNELNLAELLQVMDGIVDTPGRIVIMTTNRPDDIDPALIRPGRIDFVLNMDYIKPKDCCELLEYYYQESLQDEKYIQLLNTLIEKHPKLTPAKIEQLCFEYPTVPELFTFIEQVILQDKV